jgi:hypothetical protein
VGLGANLRYFRERYDAILASRDESRNALVSVRGTPDRRVARLHYDYIKKQRAEVESMLNRLSILETQTITKRSLIQWSRSRFSLKGRPTSSLVPSKVPDQARGLVEWQSFGEGL